MITDQTPVPGSIVVGLDKSQDARRALTVAMDLARRLGVGCHVVHAWAYPTLVLASPYAASAACFVDLEPGECAWLTELLAGVAADGLIVTGEIKQGPAGPAIVDVATDLDASLIVVGSVGHGAIVGALLGSVSEHCVHHACCPVVVVPPAQRADRAAHTSRARTVNAGLGSAEKVHT